MRLQEALRARDAEEIDRAAEPLLDRIFAPLLVHCERLVASARCPLGADAQDIAQDAWTRALSQMADPSGRTIRDENHFERLLWTIARTRFLDLIDRCSRRKEIELDGPVSSVSGGVSIGDTLPSGANVESALFFATTGELLPLVASAFESDAAFRQRCHHAPRRGVAQYRALILIALAEYYRDEIYSGDISLSCWFAEVVEALGVPAEIWNHLRGFCESGTDSVLLLKEVNACCGTAVRDRATLSVLRYELTRLAGQNLSGASIRKERKP